MKQAYIQRKLSLATWTTPTESNIYGSLDLDTTEVQKYLEELREQSGVKVTITHFVGRVLAEAIKASPNLNGFAAKNRFIKHDSIDISFLVHLDNGNLAQAKIPDADQTSIIEIAQKLQSKSESLRKEKDKDHTKSVNLIRILPVWLIRPLLKFISFLTCDLGIDAKAFGLFKHPFGSCMITSVGMFGIDKAYAPFTPFAKVPILVLVGRIKDEPIALNGEVVIRPIINLSATIDHRIVDGYQISKLAHILRDYFQHPRKLSAETTPPAQTAISTD